MGNVLAEGWITTEEAQSLTGYAKEHLQRLARQDKVTARKIGDQWVFERRSLEEHKATARPGQNAGACMRQLWLYQGRRRSGKTKQLSAKKKSPYWHR